MTVKAQKTLGLLTCLVMLTLRAVTSNPLPEKGNCKAVDREIRQYFVQGDVVVLRFNFLKRTIKRAGLSENSTVVSVIHSGWEGHKRIQPTDRVSLRWCDVWLPRSLPSDSGNYTCVIRSGDICFTGQISLNVYETERADINIISYPAHIQAGSDAWLKCPDLEDFVRMENPRWYKDSSDTMLPIGGGRYNREGNDTLIIRNLSAADSGLYTCRLRVLINNNLYDISRIWKLEVPAPHTHKPATTTMHSTAQVHTTLTPEDILYPRIVYPLNGSFSETSLGSSLVIPCTVSPGKQSADSIMVTWLINGQSIEETDLGGRVFQGERRVKGGNVEVWLVFLEVLEEDTGVELSCVTQSPLGKHEVVTMVKSEDSVLTWLTVGIVSSVCFLLVLSVFLYHLKPRRREKQGDYILARNDSLF